MNEHIIILDYGSQYNQLIARRIREMNVYCTIEPPDISAAEVKKKKAERNYSFRRPCKCLREKRSENRPGNFQTRNSGYRYLLRHAINVQRSWR